MDAFPAFIPLAGARVVVAGEGEAADAKARLFDGSPATVVRLTGEAAFAAESYKGARLAFVAGEASFAEQAAAAARAAGAWVNVVDRPALCEFTTPAIVDRGAVVAGIATGGAAPLLAARLRGELEALWPPGLGRVAELLRAVQGEARALWPGVRDRRAALRRVLDGPAARAALAGDPAGLALAVTALAGEAARGELLLLIAPSDPELVTLRALRALGRADRMAVVGAAPPELPAYARRDAVRDDRLSPEAAAAFALSGQAVVVILTEDADAAPWRNAAEAADIPLQHLA